MHKVKAFLRGKGHDCVHHADIEGCPDSVLKHFDPERSPVIVFMQASGQYAALLQSYECCALNGDVCKSFAERQ